MSKHRIDRTRRKSETIAARAKLGKFRAVTSETKALSSQITDALRHLGDLSGQASASARFASPKGLERELNLAIERGEISDVVELSFRLGVAEALCVADEAAPAELKDAISRIQRSRRKGKVTPLAAAVDAAIARLLPRLPIGKKPKPAAVKYEVVEPVDQSTNRKIDAYDKLVKRRIAAARLP